MKPTLSKSQHGSTLVITIITSTLVGTVLASYLQLVGHRNESSMRATAWNTAIPVLEAGIEEALTHLQFDKNNPAANEWTAELVEGQQVYWKRRALPDGSYYCVTNFNVASPAPVIHSAGYVRSPLQEDQYISRLVEVVTTNPPSLFSRAIAANGAVRLSGSVVVDGFSSAGFSSAMDAYSVPTNRNAIGGVATNSKEPKAIDVGSGHIFGEAVTGPGGDVSVNGGAVGDLDWNLNNTGIQDGWKNNNMNVAFQPNSPPDGTLSPFPPTTSVDGTNITYLPSGTFTKHKFVSNDATRPVIVTGDCTLFVESDFIVTGTGYLYIAPGASLKLYVGGRATIAGGGVVNATGLPANFSYFGLPSNTVLNVTGSANFVGTINAPSADFTISGNTSIYGAVICNTFTSSGTSSVHYDQTLGGGGIILAAS